MSSKEITRNGKNQVKLTYQAEINQSKEAIPIKKKEVAFLCGQHDRLCRKRNGIYEGGPRAK